MTISKIALLKDESIFIWYVLVHYIMQLSILDNPGFSNTH